MDKSIINFLNLKEEEEIESIQCQFDSNALTVYLSLKEKPHPCPLCLTPTSKIINQYTRKINHGIFLHKPCFIFFKQKRYFCPICQSSFNEENFLVQNTRKSRSYHTYQL